MPDVVGVAFAVERCHVAPLGLGQGRGIEAAGQAQRDEKPVAHELVKALAGHLLEDGADDAVVEVAVLVKHAGAPVDATLGSLKTLGEVWIGGIEGLAQRPRVADDVGLARVPDRGGVGQQLAQRDRPVRVVRVAQLPPQVVRHVVIEVEPALLDELHDDHGGQHLRDRGHPHEAVGGERTVGLALGVDEGATKGGFEGHLTTLEDRNRQAGECPRRVAVAIGESGQLVEHVVLRSPTRGVRGLRFVGAAGETRQRDCQTNHSSEILHGAHYGILGSRCQPPPAPAGPDGAR